MRLVIRYFFKTLRLLLTPIVLLVNWITTPKGIERPEAEQLKIDEACRSLIMYQFVSCPFCIKVRREMMRLSLNIEKRDAQKNIESREELLTGGGELKVPCLHITAEDGSVSWMYESDDIIAYLRKQFA
ncbi:MAG: glutathione S-transferase N-terminal domain-containing protein [Gammaproteobacteria bacterium]|nr:glutathione S-transferase N-terminal domain-containing protein [Gammaproteobacteria bacterium]